ncbi:uncharacterized protein YecT (DUF1311 family) [Hasllibacter halocynthiae]|uniref:Uncharacterized protein YecT (DUF1311 family) n=1 Tax=Hasllibacter halocynthiae TaxID=595589 RepID=A0A2T0X8S2_9RHOB|nr:lysozyme inhibitor LprI family protein [Hasllibacter halocynthiae]PRY95317.1 uncharacterized protein YecT (DUF1311 family) [Hasllibacter halocynthiae]
MRAAAFLALASLPAAAQGVDCASPGATTQRAICEERALRAAEAELDGAYVAALAAARDADFAAAVPGPVPNGDLVRGAQRAWVAYRDAACEAEAGPSRGGTGAGLVLLECMRRLTEARTGDLCLYAEELS